MSGSAGAPGDGPANAPGPAATSAIGPQPAATSANAPGPAATSAIGPQPAAGPGDPAPSRPVARRLHQLPMTLVVAVLAAGLLGITSNHWRKGMYAVGAAALLGALLRLVLPTREAGFLAVRGRAFDVVILGAMGLAVVVLTDLVPFVPS